MGQSLNSACQRLMHSRRDSKKKRCEQCTPYNARSLRCYHATRYIQHITEAALVGVDADPNPL